MSALEERLRKELPELADELTAASGQGDRPAMSTTPGPQDPTRDRRPLAADQRDKRRWSLAAAVMVAVVVVAVGLAAFGTRPEREVSLGGGGGEEEATASISSASPSTFGTWSPLPDAPIGPRAYAVSAWTGEEALFWAGSNLDRNFAHTDGAAYDPAADTWRSIPVPGWGHPGLTGAVLDGQLYALAKGGGVRFDLVDGTWADLPPVEGMFFAATVATDDAIWGLGPSGQNIAGQPDLATARYDPATNTWSYGPVLEGTDDQAPIVNNFPGPGSTVHWDGTEVIVWGGADGGVAFDPAGQTWRVIEPPTPPAGRPLDSLAAVTDDGLSVLVTSQTPEGPIGSLAVLRPEGWRWLETTIPIQNLETVTLAEAGDWLAVFSADRSPVTIHVPSGAWTQHDDAPLARVPAPNTVWTGDRLVVWSGVQNTDPTAPEGAVWVPPTS